MKSLRTNLPAAFWSWHSWEPASAAGRRAVKISRAIKQLGQAQIPDAGPGNSRRNERSQILLRVSKR